MVYVCHWTGPGRRLGTGGGHISQAEQHLWRKALADQAHQRKRHKLYDQRQREGTRSNVQGCVIERLVIPKMRFSMLPIIGGKRSPAPLPPFLPCSPSRWRGDGGGCTGSVSAKEDRGGDGQGRSQGSIVPAWGGARMAAGLKVGRYRRTCCASLRYDDYDLRLCVCALCAARNRDAETMLSCRAT